MPGSTDGLAALELSLPELPAGFDAVRGRDGVIAVADWARADLAASGFGPDGDGAARPSALRGRHALLELGAGDLLVRRFTHGGLLRFATGRRFRDPSRPFRELVLSAWLTRHGLATPAVAAARARRAGAFGWELALVTRRVPGATDLESVLERVRRGELARRRLAPIAGAAGALVRRLHELGFLHADLTPKNLLVDGAALAGAEPRLWLIDLDRSRIVPRVEAGARRDNLRRLWRYVERERERRGAAVGRTDVARFLRAYAPDRAERRADWRAIAAGHARGALWHRAGWLLERVFGPRA